MLAPLNANPSTAVVRIGFGYRLGWFQYLLMEVRVNMRDLLAGCVVFNPDDFVIARIVVVREIHIVVPK